MVNCRTKVGARALCVWLRKCKIVIGEVKGESFIRLLEALVDSVLLYGQRCGDAACRQTDPLVQVQLRGARIFLGVGRLHPRSAIEYEMRMMPLI